MLPVILLWSACSNVAQGPELAESKSSPETRPNVLLITIDTLRADYVSAYGKRPGLTPTLDSLAADGVLFETAYCQVPMTPASHASILTGTYPATHGIRDFTAGRLAPGIPTLASFLSEQGYSTAAFVSAFVLDSSWGLDKGFETYSDSFDAEDFERLNPGNVQRRAGPTVDLVLDWLKTAREPYFLWMHLFDPHHDYDPPEPFKSRYQDDPYAGEVAYADSQIGRLIAHLKETGQYPHTLVIATSDHGEGLGDHQENEHGFFLYEAVTRVPLIFKLPAGHDLRGKRLSTLAQSVDILPTTLQILERTSTLPEGVEGRSLLPAMLGEADSGGFAYAETQYPKTTFGWSPLRFYREGNFKLIEAPRSELYDLQQDPRESHNLAPDQDDVVERLRHKMQALESGFGSASSTSQPPADLDERMKRLGALGYVSVPQPGSPSEDESKLPDPKDQIEVYNRILEGLQAGEAGKLREANQILEELASENPKLFILQHQIGTNLFRMGEIEKAHEYLSRANQLNPDFSPTQVSLARVLARLGRQDEAIQLLERPGPTSGDLPVRRELASLYNQKGRFEQARKLSQEILRDRPDDLQTLRILGVAEVETRDYAAGLQTLDRAIELGLDDAVIRNSRGIALSNLGRPREAIESYRRAIQLNPRYPMAHLNLALTLLQHGSRDEAEKSFQALCQINRPLCERYRARFQ